ncbi:MAG: M28 family peptidase [Candidatus Helarchaeota archaeon]
MSSLKPNLLCFFLILLFIRNFLIQSKIPLVYTQIGQHSSTIISQSSILQFNATNAYNLLDTQLNFGFRVPGFAAHETCADWIEQILQNITDTIIIHEFIVQKVGHPAYYCQNILGKLNTNKNNILILGAHWDSRAVAEKDSFNQTDPIPGANDGASGVAVLLELAKIFTYLKDTLNTQIWFLFLDAEDQGKSKGIYGLEGWRWCEGSIAFNNNLKNFYNPSNESIECFILLDMVGGTYLKFIDEARSTNKLQDAIFAQGRNLNYTEQFPNNPKSMIITDDHQYFIENGIPSVDLIIDFSTGSWSHHHKHSDNLANIDIQSLNITGRTIESFVKTYYGGSELPEWGMASMNDMWKHWLWPVLLIACMVLVFVLLIKYSPKNEL